MASEKLSPGNSGQWYDVYRRLFPFGIREWLDRIKATTRLAAEQRAEQKHGVDVIVVLACGSKRYAQRTPEEIEQQRMRARRHAR